MEKCNTRSPARFALSGRCPQGHRNGDTVDGQFADQRVHHFGLTSRDRYVTARRITSASCSSSRIRFLASRSSANSFSVTPGFTLSSTLAFLSQFARHDLRDSEVLRDLGQRGFMLASDRDDIASKLGWVGLGHGDILPAETNLHRSGVNQTGGSPNLRFPRLYPVAIAVVGWCDDRNIRCDRDRLR